MQLDLAPESPKQPPSQRFSQRPPWPGKLDVPHAGHVTKLNCK